MVSSARTEPAALGIQNLQLRSPPGCSSNKMKGRSTLRQMQQLLQLLRLLRISVVPKSFLQFNAINTTSYKFIQHHLRKPTKVDQSTVAPQ